MLMFRFPLSLHVLFQDGPPPQSHGVAGLGALSPPLNLARHSAPHLGLFWLQYSLPALWVWNETSWSLQG